MSSVCEVCGNANRPGAMFCSGCTARLPAFKPTGPSALQAMRDSQSPFDLGAHGVGTRASGPSARALRAAPSYFWQGLGLLVLAMVLVFAGWFAYVTRKTDGPGPSRAVASAPSAAVPEAPAGNVVAALAPIGKPADPAPITASVSPPVPVAPSATAPPAAEPATAAVRAERRSSRSRQAGESRTTGARAAPSYGDAEPQFQLPRRPMSVARAQDDPGPPIAAGPGPVYSWTVPRSSRVADDPGPPVAAGPGPQYEGPRTPVRAPVWLAGDPGPPVAIGPGPQVDYSTGRSRSAR